MNRKDFIKTCGFACLGATAMASFLQSCMTFKTINGQITGDDLVVPLSNFEPDNDQNNKTRNYLVVTNSLLLYPICVFKLSEAEYSALWMRCTHQGTELQVFGSTLQCPAHGSEFDNQGGLMQGPAEKPLRTFPVKLETDQLKISLKAI
jgi:Rieske Fe-S protein